MSIFTTARTLVICVSIGSVTLVACKIKTYDSEVKIVGGQKAENEKFAHVVMLFPDLDPKSKEICSGLIIGPRTIVSASHCIKKASGTNANAYNNPLVRIPSVTGDRYVNSKHVYTFTKNLAATSINEHEVGLDFSILDFAVDQTTGKGPFSNFAPFPKIGVAKPGDSVILVGFGATDHTNVSLGEKYYGTNQVVTVQNKIGSIVVSGLQNNQNPAPSTSSALISRGDSGGPMLSQDGTKVFGIISSYEIQQNGGKVDNYFAQMSHPRVIALFEYYRGMLNAQSYQPVPEEALFEITNTRTLDSLKTTEDLSRPNLLWTDTAQKPRTLVASCGILSFLFSTQTTNDALSSTAGQGSVLTFNFPFGGGSNVIVPPSPTVGTTTPTAPVTPSVDPIPSSQPTPTPTLPTVGTDPALATPDPLPSPGTNPPVNPAPVNPAGSASPVVGADPSGTQVGVNQFTSSPSVFVSVPTTP